MIPGKARDSTGKTWKTQEVRKVSRNPRRKRGGEKTARKWKEMWMKKLRIARKRPVPQRSLPETGREQGNETQREETGNQNEAAHSSLIHEC